MAVSVDTSTDSQAVEGRSVAVDSTGRIWVMHYSLADTRYEFWYSDDEGATFSEATSLRFTFSSVQGGAAFHINTVTDRAVFCYSTNSPGGIDWKFVEGIDDTASWTNGQEPFALQVGVSGIGDIVSFDKPGSSNWIMAMVMPSPVTPGRAIISILEYTSGGTFVADRTPSPGYVITVDAAATTGHGQRLDFRHTGDEGASTVASSTPDLFIASGASSALNFFKLSYSAGTWTIGPARNLTTDGTGIRAAIFDGTRFVMAMKDNSPTTNILVYERDVADTTTTARTPPSLSGTVTAIDLSYDTDQNIVLFAVDDTLDDVWYVVFNRVAGTWGSWTKLEASTATAVLSVSRGHSLTMIHAVWASGFSSPYTVTYEGLSVNVAPDPATWVSPVDGSAQDRGAALVLDWDFNDTPTDEQSAYHLSRSVNGGALEYYNAGTGTWSGTETKNTTTTTSVTLASGWAADGDEVVYRVRTYDKFDVVASAYSAGLTIIASVPVTPTLDAPAMSATLVEAQPTVSWTVSEQTAYRVRVLSSSDVQLYSTGKITDSVTDSIVLPYVLNNGLTDLKFELTTWNNEDLAATDTTTLVDVAYDEPATPVLTVTAVPAGGYIQVAIADPTPTGDEPDVVYHDIYVRVADGGVPDGERTVNDDGIRISTGTVPENGTFLDYAAGSGIDYQYRSRAVGANGTSTYSAWA